MGHIGHELGQIMTSIIFRQLFDATTSTYTYLLADSKNREGIIIDSVLEQTERDLQLIHELKIKLKYILETHVHADHITGADVLRQKTGAKVALCRASNAKGADLLLEDGDEIFWGGHSLKAIWTPGHTPGCTSYFFEDRVFTGDTLFIRSNGRTDFQNGSAEQLYENVHRKLFTLSPATLVYPGHDYKGMTVSTIGEEMEFNTRLNVSISKEQFVRIMNDLKLDKPKRIDVAVPANLKCGKV